MKPGASECRAATSTARLSVDAAKGARATVTPRDPASEGKVARAISTAKRGANDSKAKAVEGARLREVKVDASAVKAVGKAVKATVNASEATADREVKVRAVSSPAGANSLPAVEEAAVRVDNG